MPMSRIYTSVLTSCLMLGYQNCNIINQRHLTLQGTPLALFDVFKNVLVEPFFHTISCAFSSRHTCLIPVFHSPKLMFISVFKVIVFWCFHQRREAFNTASRVMGPLQWNCEETDSDIQCSKSKCTSDLGNDSNIKPSWAIFLDSNVFLACYFINWLLPCVDMPNWKGFHQRWSF